MINYWIHWIYWIEEAKFLCEYLPMPIAVLGQELETEKIFYNVEGDMANGFHQRGEWGKSQYHLNKKLSAFHRIQVITKVRIWKLEWLFLKNIKEQYGSTKLPRHNRESL